MRAALTGAPVKAVGFYYDRPTMVFVGRPWRFASVRDLQGKNIAILSYGSAVDFATRQILRAHGLADKDYTLVPMGPYAKCTPGIGKGPGARLFTQSRRRGDRRKPGGRIEASRLLRRFAEDTLLRVCRKRSLPVAREIRRRCENFFAPLSRH